MIEKSGGGARVRLERVAAAAATLPFLYRFANADLVLFTNDEPHLLDAAESEAHGGGWVLANPVQGTQHLHYGPVPTWIYGVVHALFGPSPAVSALFMGALVTIGQLVALLLITRILRGGPRLFAVLALVVAASPFDFIWSRVPWDNTLLLGTFACGALLLARDELTRVRCVLAGGLFGLSIGTHLMVLPSLVVIAIVTLATRRDRWRETLFRVPWIVAPAAVIVAPYLVYLARTLSAPPPAVAVVTTAAAKHVPPPFSVTAAATTILDTVLQPARNLTTSGISYFFDDAWDDFRARLGSAAFFAHDLPYALFLAGLAIAGLVVTLRGPAPRETKRLAWMAAACWAGHALFLLVDGLDPHPHYQHPVWWTIPTGIALLVVRLRDTAPGRARVLSGALAVIAAVHVGFLPWWNHYLRETNGTRGIHYTAPLGGQQAFLRDACSLGADVVIENRTVVFDAALSYLGRTEPACVGKHVTICREACADLPGRHVTLEYAGPVGGHFLPAR